MFAMFHMKPPKKISYKLKRPSLWGVKRAEYGVNGALTDLGKSPEGPFQEVICKTYHRDSCPPGQQVVGNTSSEDASCLLLISDIFTIIWCTAHLKRNVPNLFRYSETYQNDTDFSRHISIKAVYCLILTISKIFIPGIAHRTKKKIMAVAKATWKVHILQHHGLQEALEVELHLALLQRFHDHLLHRAHGQHARFVDLPPESYTFFVSGCQCQPLFCPTTGSFTQNRYTWNWTCIRHELTWKWWLYVCTWPLSSTWWNIFSRTILSVVEILPCINILHVHVGKHNTEWQEKFGVLTKYKHNSKWNNLPFNWLENYGFAGDWHEKMFCGKQKERTNKDEKTKPHQCSFPAILAAADSCRCRVTDWQTAGAHSFWNSLHRAWKIQTEHLTLQQHTSL